MTEDRNNRKGVKLRQWRQEDMNQALRACREDNLGLRAAARLYNVPRKTLGDRFNKKVSSLSTFCRKFNTFELWYSNFE